MTSSVPFLVAKARAHIGKSPGPRDALAMINAGTLNEAENILNTYEFYAEAFDKVRPSVDAVEFEGTLRKQFGMMLNKYSTSASPLAKEIIEAYKYRVEAENLQVLFRAFVANDTDEDILNFLVPVNKFGFNMYKRILNATSIRNAAEFIYFPELRKTALKAIDLADSDDELIFYMVSGLSHQAYSVIYKANKNVKAEIDLLNLETVARAIVLGTDAKQWIIPGIGHVAREIDSLSRMSSPQSVVAAMINKMSYSSYLRDVINAPDESVITVLEDSVNEALMKNHWHNFRIHGSQKEAIFNFFSLKQAEIHDIATIFTGKSNNISAERIKKALLYFNV